MIDLLKFMQESGGIYLFLIFLVMLFASVKRVYEGVTWCLEKLNGYHVKLSSREKKEENFTEKMEELEMVTQSNNDMFNKLGQEFLTTKQEIKEIKEFMHQYKNMLDGLKEDIKSIQISMTDNKEKDDEFALAMCRNTMNDLWKEAKSAGHKTQAAFETFESLKSIYLSRNGNAYFKHYVIPEFEELPFIEEVADGK